MVATSLQAQSQPEVLMPVPKSIEWTNDPFRIPADFSVNIEGPDGLLNGSLGQYTQGFIQRLGSLTGYLKLPTLPTQQNAYAHLTISIELVSSVELGVDESYQLTVEGQGVQLSAATDIGAMRGLETLLQLVAYDAEGPYIRGVRIQDEPRFGWRGLLLDVSRHFMPVHVVKRTLDGMAAVKMNVLHWHLCDDHGWRVELKNSPELHEKASNGEYYTQDQIHEIVAYAAERGIRVMPEVDVPGHASAILTAYPELGSKDTTYALQIYAGIFDPTLDPTNEATYDRLQIVFEEMATLFPDGYFHIGGDENEGKHWEENEEIQAFMKEKGYADQHELQNYFNVRLQEILAPLGKKMMGWDEILDGDLPTSAMIQAWRGWIAEPENLPHARAARKGHQVVVSMGYYIDLLLPAESHYLADPMPVEGALTEEQAENILGGEACMWAELITPASIDSRLWPRTAAVAERLWSPVAVNDVASMYRRLEVMNRHLELLGLQHLSFADQYVRRTAVHAEDQATLRTLLGVCEPMKGYTRNTNGTLYTVNSPYNLFVDACTADASQALAFKQEVEAWIENGDPAAAEAIRSRCITWSNLKTDLEFFQRIPEGKALQTHLKGLVTLSQLAAQLTEPGAAENADLLEKAEAALEVYKTPQARTDLMLVPTVQKLLDHIKS